MAGSRDRRWRLAGLRRVPVGDLRTVRRALAAAAAARGTRPVQAAGLPRTVRWLAQDWLPATPKAVANLVRLIDLTIAYQGAPDREQRSALSREITEAELRQLRLGKSGGPARNSRCYCGSGRKYKHCHGAELNWVVELSSAPAGEAAGHG